MSSPSAIHEGIVSLFRNCPELAPILLRTVAKHSLPEFTRGEIGSENLTAIKPVEFRADGVTLLVHSARVFGIVVEVQLAIDGRKRYTWPAYVTNLRAQHEIPVALLVVTPYLAVANWANEPIHLGQGSTITPAVIGPDEIPLIIDIDFSERSPELAVLSAMAHGNLEPTLSAAAALSALDACNGVPEERLVLYSDLIISSLGHAARGSRRHRHPADMVGRVKSLPCRFFILCSLSFWA